MNAVNVLRVNIVNVLHVTAVKCFTYVSCMFQTDHHGPGVRELPGAPAGGRETERQDRRPEEPEASARCRHLPDTLVHIVMTLFFSSSSSLLL